MGFGCPQCGEGMILRAVFVLPPLSMTLLDAMNWRGPPFGTGFSDNEPWMYSVGLGESACRVGFCVLHLIWLVNFL